MSTWILLAILAQALAAVSTFVDRYILTHGKGIGSPLTYAFYISLLSGVVVILLPFGVISAPNAEVIKLSLVMAVFFILSLFLLYSAFKEGKVSDVMPVVAAFSATSSFILAHLYLDENLPDLFIFSVILFIFGTALISRFRFTHRSLMLTLGAGLLFGASAFIAKLIFLETSFWDGFFWSRMANVLGAGMLLFWPGNMKAIFHGGRSSTHGTRWTIIGNKTLSGIAGILTFFAISLGSVSVVNAMSGLQFAFLLIFAYLFAERFPRALSGEVEKHGLAHKLFGVTVIMVGILILFIA